MIRSRNIDPKTPARSVTVRDQFIIKTPPTSATLYATAQTITTGTTTTLNLDGTLWLANTQSVDSAGTATVSATSATLALPSDLWFTLSSAIAITGTVDGYDHMGNPVYFEFSKSSAQTVFTLSQSTQVTITKNGDSSRSIPGRSVNCCYSAINKITITNASGSSPTISVGVLNTGGNAFRMPRIPLPVPVKDANDMADVVLLSSVGGATVTTPAAVPGQCSYSTTALGNGDLLVLTNGQLVETVAGTAPYEWYVMYRGGRNVLQ